MTVITDRISSSFSVITSGQKGKNAIPYHELLKCMAQSSISLIPINADRPKTYLCGLTSFLDALALGQSIIMSDNTNISVDIEALGIGLVYKAGDETDLISKIEYMRTHPKYTQECGINARKYVEKCSYKEYCEQLERLM